MAIFNSKANSGIFASIAAKHKTIDIRSPYECSRISIEKLRIHQLRQLDHIVIKEFDHANKVNFLKIQIECVTWFESHSAAVTVIAQH